MIVCICDSLNDNQLKFIIKSTKIRSVKDIHKLHICNNCKKCCKEIKKLIEENNNGFETVS